MRTTALILFLLCFFSREITAQTVAYQYDSHGNIISRTYIALAKTRAMADFPDMQEIKEKGRKGITVSPNPTKDFIIVRNHDTVDEEIVTYQLFDMSSKLMTTVKSTKVDTRIDLSQFPSGIYVLRIQDKKNNHAPIKIVKL